MEALLLYLFVFFVPGRVTIWYILFWAIVFGLIAALLVTYRLRLRSKKVWIGLLLMETAALVWANVASKWHLRWDTLSQSEMLIPRVGVGVYAFVTVLSVIALCISIRKKRIC